MSPADMVHLHLLLNHVPTMGSALAIALLVASLVRRSQDLQRASLEALFIVAVITLPTYVTGVASQAARAAQSDVPNAAVAAHQNAAVVAFFWMQLTGLVAWVGLWRWRRNGVVPRRSLAGAMALSVVTLASLADAANRGGSISHPDAAWGTTGSDWIDATALGLYTISHLWVWPTLEILHFIGMALSFGILSVVCLQVMGFMAPAVPYAAVHRLLPWGMAGMSVSVATGMLFVNGVGPQYTENPAFFIKIGLLVGAGLAYLYLTVAEAAWSARTGLSRREAQFVAALCLLFSFGIMYVGRMLPYLRSAF